MTIAFLPVRGGSKSIPLKNIMPLAGRPLVGWMLEALCRAPGVDRVVVATDHDQIEAVVRSFGEPKVEIYRRNAQNAADTSSTESAMLEYFEAHPVSAESLIVLAQATSPLTTSEDVGNVLSAVTQPGVDSALTVVEFKRFLWTGAGEPVNYDPAKRPRRQDWEGQLLENGALYATRAGLLTASRTRISGKICPVSMRSETSFEIDEPEDWTVIEALIKKRQSRGRPAPAGGRIKLVLTDVDGVLTDAGMYYSNLGDELKKFNTRDGMAVEIGRKAGLEFGIVTGESTQIVQRRAAKLGIDLVIQGSRNKREDVQRYLESKGLSWDEVAYIGDDLNDIEILSSVGLSYCPSDAIGKVRSTASTILSTRGGEGCLREVVDQLLSGEGGSRGHR